MHGPGEPDKRAIDKKIAALLAKGTPEAVEQAIKLFHEHRGPLVFGILRKVFPGISDQDLRDIYESGLDALKSYALSGHFKQKESGTGTLALMKQIVIWDGIDFLRGEGRRRAHELKYALRLECIDIDSLEKLGDLFIAINEFIDANLKELPRVAVRAYVLLLRSGDGLESDESLESLLVEKVNHILGEPDLSEEEILSAFESGMRTLRKKYWENGGFVP